MITFPNAKINLGLNIVERRPDGYHNIETVFFPVPLTDVLEIVPADSADTSLTCYGNPVDCPPEKNLVMKAYRLLQQRYDLPPVSIHLYPQCRYIFTNTFLTAPDWAAARVMLHTRC